MGFTFSRKTLRKLWGNMFSKKGTTREENVEVVPVQNIAGNKDTASRTAALLSAATSRRISIHEGASMQLVPPARVEPGPSTTHASSPIANAGEHTREVDTTERESREAPFQQMFGDNLLVKDGKFMIGKTVIVNNERILPNLERAGFKLLLERVAPAAFHNSAQRDNPPRCHPDMRVKILNTIYDWIIQSEEREKWLMWLNGAAGAGKSAIMQSIAERCAQAGIAIASFFFSRSDPTRNTMVPLIPTLVYQLIQAIPETADDILQTIESNPLIFDHSFEFQLQWLIIQPLARLPTYLQRLFVVLIDGLDECNGHNNHSNLISVFSKISSGKDIPVVFLIASRRERQIEAAFVTKQVSDLLVTLPLDNSDIEKTSDDIRRFVNNKFNDIKTTHLNKAVYLPADWPPSSSIDEIIAKSSGQFIYASVIVNFISLPHGHPARQLDVIKGIRPHSHSENPFAHLDALYQYIFSQVEEHDVVRDILAFRLIPKEDEWLNDIDVLEELFQLTPGKLEVYFANLTAIIQSKPHTKDDAEMKFLHARTSFPDFLLDKSRSEEYHIDLDECCTKLLCVFLERPPPILDPLSLTQNLDVVSSQENWRLRAIENLLGKVKASDRLQAACMSFNFTFYNTKTANKNSHCFPELLDYLKRLDLNDLGQAYSHVVNVFAGEYAKYWPELDGNKQGWVSGSYDLLARIYEIRQEKL